MSKINVGDLVQVISTFRPMAGRAGEVTKINRGEDTLYWVDHGLNELKYNRSQIKKLRRG